MRDNLFVKNFDELLVNVKQDIQEGELQLYFCRESSDSIFKELLVQPLERRINGKEICFFAIRNVKLKNEFKGKGYLSSFLNELEKLELDLIFHDVINERLFNFLLKKGYNLHKEIKYDCEVLSLYKLKLTRFK